VRRIHLDLGRAAAKVPGLHVTLALVILLLLASVALAHGTWSVYPVGCGRGGSTCREGRLCGQWHLRSACGRCSRHGPLCTMCRLLVRARDGGSTGGLSNLLAAGDAEDVADPVVSQPD